MEAEDYLKKIIRTGKVSCLKGNKASVEFGNDKTISADLKVIDRGDGWKPTTGKMVLCICLPGGEGDGFIIGGL